MLYSACDGLWPDAVGEVGGLSPDAVGDDARRSRLGPPVAEISTDLAQAWRERAFQGALAGLARDFE